jgi:hypothetical protein
MKKFQCMALGLFLSFAFLFSFSTPISAAQVDGLNKGDSQVQMERSSVTGLKLNNNLLAGNYKKIDLPKNLKPANSAPTKDSNSRTNENQLQASNTPPVAGLEYAILNPETLKNGEITTDTQIAWLWSYNGQDYSYDPDGDPITGYYFGGIPAGYVLGELVDNSGNAFGFVTQCSDAGHYDLQFQVADSRGAFSDIVVYSFDVVNVEDYISFTGTFSSQNDVQTHNVTIDFSKTPSVAVCLVRTDFNGVAADIKDSGNNIVETLDVKGDTGKGEYSGRSWVVLNRPTDSADICNYSIDIKPLNSDTGSYTLSIGSSDYIEAMTSGVKNAVLLSYFAPAIIDVIGENYTKTTNRGNVYVGKYIPNKKESFYEFTGTGAMTISVFSDDSNLRFKILNSELQMLYDSNTDNNAHRTKFLDTRKAGEKVKITTQSGENYYLVVYTPENLQTPETTFQDYSFFMGVGEPFISGNIVRVTAPSVTATESTYSPYVSFTVSGMPSTASPYQIGVSNEDGSAASKLGTWNLKRSDSSTVYSGYNVLTTKIPYDWGSSQQLKLGGTWNFRFLSRYSTSTLQPEISFSYLFELGD